MIAPRHQHHHHHHAVGRDADRRYLSLALALLCAFMLAEVAVGIMASSLALVSDAGHMLTDAAAIGLALFAMAAAARPAGGSFTWGFKRVEILSAQANGITLLLLAVWFAVEAVRRLLKPPAVEGRWVLLVALVGIVVNFGVLWLMRKADRRSLNIQGSYKHILTDLYAFIATAVAGGLIWATGWVRLDPVAALLVSALMARAGFGLVRDSGRIFMEAAPRDIAPTVVAEAILAIPAVTRLADLHVWEVGSGFPALSAHVHVRPDVDCHDKRREIAAMLRARFGIDHVTLQTDHACAGDDGHDGHCQLEP
ncbi:MAG TPA: cation diffusion facilitator family transporter [Rhodanobacteraceae bacterium]|nr:cation diffusion facilitator family transporter [Rhodanobacteraceae bacterium]